METKIKNASVKVMLSFDYSHFETSISVENENGLSLKDIDEARKNCQRLSDKAVLQYKKFKAELAKRNDSNFKMENFKANAERALKINHEDRTVAQAALIKEYEQDNWRKQFMYDEYDYEDDENDYGF